ncbi:DUF882 domain-containing protein [Pannonibacter sp. SL95]|uniref:DUF882 domain-containing protein n=1 Tax=Pannonibacter sp. SL95 TaxID=2995153 RepID=UPI0022747A18|nr:DUF882 domain-containing protein [Pannonibacter sp. SL95]MCY1704799.1 DUF882 domain-containing protein [Pannonibacter sp. SL95]
MGAFFVGPSVVAPDQSAAQAETRTLKLYNTHTKERVQITFKKDGRYIPSGLRDANRFLRDWRRNEITNIDPKLLDLVWEVYQQVRGGDYIHVVSSYRSPATNNMLRSRSRGVAKNSQHSLGKAMDFFIPGVNLTTLRATGLRKQVGGVGFYPTSGSPFVHMDTGSVRHWPKMSRQQLAQVFPDGKTVHIPSDGKPMAGYQLALADIKSGRRGNSKIVIASGGGEEEEGGSSTTSGQILTAGDNGDLVRPAAGNSRGFLASLFSGEDDDVEQASADGESAPVKPTPQRPQRPAATEQAPGVKTPPPSPWPPSRARRSRHLLHRQKKLSPPPRRAASRVRLANRSRPRSRSRWLPPIRMHARLKRPSLRRPALARRCSRQAHRLRSPCPPPSRRTSRSLWLQQRSRHPARRRSHRQPIRWPQLLP